MPTPPTTLHQDYHALTLTFASTRLRWRMDMPHQMVVKEGFLWDTINHVMVRFRYCVPSLSFGGSSRRRALLDVSSGALAASAF